MKPILHLFAICLLFCLFRISAQFFPNYPVNSIPITGLILYSVYFFQRKGLYVAATVWLISYPILSFLQGHAIVSGLLTTLLGCAPTVFIGLYLHKNSTTRWSHAFLGTLTGAFSFYLLTNTFSWLANPIYTKNIEGFMQAQWFGHPTFPLPTWVFLRNSLIANTIFSSVIHLSLGKASSPIGQASMRATS